MRKKANQEKREVKEMVRKEKVEKNLSERKGEK